jgi:hypothetical protein
MREASYEVMALTFLQILGWYIAMGFREGLGR